MLKNNLSRNKFNISILYLITLILIFYSITIFYKDLKMIYLLYVFIVFLDSFVYSRTIIKETNIAGRMEYIIPLTASAITEILLVLYILFISLRNKINVVYDVLFISSLFVLIYILIILMFIFGWKKYKIALNSKLNPNLTVEISKFNSSNYQLSIFITTNKTPASSIFYKKEKKLNVYFNEDFIKMLDLDEIKAVVFHEIGHVKTTKIKKSTLMYIFPIILYLYLNGYLYFGSIKASYISIIVLVFMIVSFLYITRKLPHIMLNNEYNADKYAINFVGVDNMINTLVKIEEYYNVFIYTNLNHNYREINFRINKIGSMNLHEKDDVKNEAHGHK